MIKKLIHSALNFLFPQKCVGCGQESNLPFGGLCEECLEKIGFSSLIKYKNIFSASDYNDEIAKKTIWLLKYRGIKQLAEPLAELMRRRLWQKIPRGDWLIIPVPISKKRLKERGFNQAELIAKNFALKTGAEIKNNALQKITDTPTQVSIKNREERLNNLKGAFAVKNPETIKGRNIILIDDVFTTGATIAEARKVLRDSGAKKIIAMVAARG